MEEDKKLYKEFLNGDKDSFEKIIIKYKNNLLYFITRFVKNIEIAEDIFQDVILYILENKEYYNFNYSFKTYIYMIAKSKTLDFMKKYKNIESLESSNIEIEDKKILEEIILTKERQKKIQNILAKLSNEYQLVIYLTQIEGLSYKETALIMGKKESQIKTLAFNARKKLKKMMVDEKIVEFKGNKLIKLLSWFIIISVITSTMVYAGLTLYNKIKANLIPSYTIKILENNSNTIWIGSFQLAWNELIEYFGHEINFLENDSKLAGELNKKVFNKDMLSTDDYYIKVGKTNQNLKKQIIKDLNEKFDLDSTNLLNQVNFDDRANSFTIYSILRKKFEFINKFDSLNSEVFNNGEEKVKYFGINNESDENLNFNIEILFFEYNNDEYAVKLNTKNNEEVILYRTNKNESFETLYNNILEAKKNFDGNNQFTEHDQIKIPYIDLDAVVNYEELCNKIIKNTDGAFIQNALQSVKFSLNEKGVNLSSEAIIKEVSMSIYPDARYFYFNKNFVIFLKEENKELPYFALKVDNLDVLVKEK